jgi:ketosteroid isomerase-like protein
MTNDPKTIALAYIDACGRKELGTVARLLAEDVTFAGPASKLAGADAYLAVLRRVGTVWVRSDVKRVFVDGNEVCVIYDFVSDTPAGAVPTIEWLRIEDGRIASIRLFFDRVAFKPAADELARRAGAPVAAAS